MRKLNVDLVPLGFRIDFRDFCRDSLDLNRITEAFESSGISKGEDVTRHSSTRRNLVESYYSSVDWGNPSSAQRILKVVELLLELNSTTEEGREKLRTLCVKHNLLRDGRIVSLIGRVVGSDIKNLIFAANGPKPRIVLEDSLTNTIRVVDNEQYCLIYDRVIPDHGLLWVELLDWWRGHAASSNVQELGSERTLLLRLRQSLLDSKPEQILFDTYFEAFRTQLKDALPALLPQVYLHFDPYTQSHLTWFGKDKVLARQRMDFLMLLPNGIRVVIEVDGKQHYSDDGVASPRRYGEMMAEDRRLRFSGYELFRFGGYELSDVSGNQVVKNFFSSLFSRYALQ